MGLFIFVIGTYTSLKQIVQNLYMIGPSNLSSTWEDDQVVEKYEITGPRVCPEALS